MAEVFRARLDGPMGFQKDVAIKRIRESYIKDDEEYVQALVNEARIGGQLRHPNVIEVYEFGSEEGSFYIAMEYVRGATLSELLREARGHKLRLPPAVVVDVAVQVARGLTYAHNYHEGDTAMEIVHRDLKPSNIMLSINGTAKILDFGIAKSNANLFDSTATGVAKGTPLYMSPEQLRGERPLPRQADLWSLGVILYEMCVGRLLFGGETVPEIINRVLSFPLEDRIEEADRMVSGIGPILESCLQRDWRDRVADARELEVELRHVLDWQDRSIRTVDFMKSFHAGQLIGGQPIPAPSRELDAQGNPVVPVGGGQAEETRHHTLVRYYERRARRRAVYSTLMGLTLLALVGSAGLYIWRSTLGVSYKAETATQSLNRGDIEGALAQWRSALQDNPGSDEPRVAAAVLGALSGESIEELEASLSHLPESQPERFVRKYQLLAWVNRRAGRYTESFRNLKLAMDKVRNTPGWILGPPPSLLWEAGEVAIILEAESAAAGTSGYFRTLSNTLPPGELADAAGAYVESIEAGRAAILRAELLWIDGHEDDAFGDLNQVLQDANLSTTRNNNQRLVWAYRALGARRYKDALSLLAGMGRMTDDPRMRFAHGVARTAALAAGGQVQTARRELRKALKHSSLDRDGASARLQLAAALLHSGRERAWIEELLDEATTLAQNGDRDQDVRRLMDELNARWPSSSSTPQPPADPTPPRPEGSLALDPRSGRFYPATSLSRGTPSGALLVPPTAFNRQNTSAAGLAFPFGPTFHPVDREPLPRFYHPGK